MSTIRFPGLQTGIDTATLISQLMAAESRTLNIYEDRKSVWEEKQTALSDLKSKLDALRSTVRNLSNASELRAYTVASSDTDILTAEASYNTYEGNHSVVINQLATSERHVHNTGKEYAEDTVGGGTFIYSYNHQESIITTTASTTLQEFVDLINNDAGNPGVTATLLYYNDAYHMVLSGNDAGSDYEISINSSNTEVWQAESELTAENENATLTTKIIDLDQFEGILVGGEYITISGTTHDGTSVSQDYYITENTKVGHLISEINDTFAGTATATLVNGEIVLTDHTSGTSQMQLSLTYNAGTGSTTFDVPTISQATTGGSVTASLADFTETDFTETQSAQDSQVRVDGYPPVRAEVQILTTTQAANNGTFTLTYDGQTTESIAYDADAATIQAALEALSNVNVGDITVSGDGPSSLGTTSFTFLNSLGDVSQITIDASNLNPGSEADYTMSTQTEGDLGWICRSSNTIDDVIQGVTLHLHDTGTVDVNLTRDVESIKEKLNKMVEAYNAAVLFIKEKTGYNDVLKAGGVLMGDFIISSIKSELNLPLISQTDGFIIDIDTFLMPGQIGLELDEDDVLTLDTTVFDEAIAEDYLGVLAIIGADKSGSSDSNTIEFYGASSDYTTAGTYDVEVTILGGEITSARIKLSSESTYRDATFDGNIITGDSTFDDNGYPVYAENSLQLSVDLSQDGTFTAVVRVKQGFAGELEDALDKMLRTTNGSIKIDQDYIADNIEYLDDKIELEEERLTRREARLVARYARLEQTLALLQSQMAALGLG